MQLSGIYYPLAISAVHLSYLLQDQTLTFAREITV